MVALWPENVESFEIFCALESQWRMVAGFGVLAYTGLIYSEAIGLMKERGIKRARRLELLGDLQAMERAAVPVLNAKGEADE